jgi:hypothetical protein
MWKSATKTSLILATTFIFAWTATAQVVITRGSIEDFLNTQFSSASAMSYDAGGIVALLDVTGAGQTWDFTALNYEYFLGGDTRIQTFSSPEGTPGEEYEHFDQATHVSRADLTLRETQDGEEVEITFTNYEFSILNDESYTVLGSMIKDFLEPDQVDLLLFSRPGRVQYEFPVTYGSSWDTEYEEQLISGGFDVTSDYNEQVVVDGWGEIVTPEGTFQVLRVSRHRKLDMGSVTLESLEVDFVNENGLPLATIIVDIDPDSGEYDLEYAEASLSLIATGTSADDGLVADVPDRCHPASELSEPVQPVHANPLRDPGSLARASGGIRHVRPAGCASGG